MRKGCACGRGTPPAFGRPMNNDFDLFLRNAKNKGDLKYTENFSLSSVSSAGTGGKARLFVTPYSVKSLTDTLGAARKSGIYFTVVGNASNVLFSDSGFNGAVISTAELNGICLDGGEIYAECGAMLPRLSRFALENSLSGLEGLVSVPGTVGGALVSNAGAFGNEISDTLLSFSVYLPEGGRTEERTKEGYPFSYRESRATEGNAVILSAKFAPKAGVKSEIYAKMTESIERRRVTQPIGVKSVGSFFKRPSTESLCDVPEKYRGRSAGELIELCGLKGKMVGGAAVSEKHAGFLVNAGNATSRDFLALAEIIKDRVFEGTGVLLTEECRIIPSDGYERREGNI